MGEICPLGVKFTLRGEYNLLFRRMERQTENFRDFKLPNRDFTPRGQSSPLRDNVAPGDQSLPLGEKLRMDL
jgi:hypothetical protein